MRKVIPLVLTFILSVFVFQSCEDALDVNQEFELTQEIPVVSETAAIDGNSILDASAGSSYIADYGDKIKTIEILEAKYSLTSFTGPDDQKINNALFKVSDEAGAGEATISTITDQNLKELTTTEKSLTINQAGVDRLAELIKSAPHKAKLWFVGDASSAPLVFTLKVKFKVKMVANPL